MKVFKFGGASVRDAEQINNVSDILEQYKGQKIVLVVSAAGKTTNALEKVLKHYFDPTGDPIAELEKVKLDHKDILSALFKDQDKIATDLNDTFVEIEWQLEDQEENYDFAYDQIVSVGELLSTKIVFQFLLERGMSVSWLDARDVIVTDNNYREANIDWDKSQKKISQKVNQLFQDFDLVITQGFIGSSTENYSTTLGREGSDFTASIFAHCLDAKEVVIWKDVPGILTGDPTIFKEVKKLDNLSYSEAIEMSYYGAKVIHPKTIKPLQNKKIPLYVKSFINPTGLGTKISKQKESSYPPIVVIAHNQVLLSIATKDFSFIAEKHMSKIFDRVSAHKLKVKLMKNTAISFLLSFDSFPSAINDLIEDLQEEFELKQTTDLELISIRHYDEAIRKKLTAGREVLFEERIPNTLQMVVKISANEA